MACYRLLMVIVDCWQSFFLSKFSRGYEQRRFSLKEWDEMWVFFPALPYCPCPAFFPVRPPPYRPFAFVMSKVKHSSK